MVDLTNNKIGDVFTSPITGEQIKVIESTSGSCKGCVFNDPTKSICHEEKLALGFTGNGCCTKRIFKKVENMNIHNLIQPGDFVKIQNDYTDEWYLCLSPDIFASESSGWNQAINDSDIQEILRPHLGFDMHSYWNYLTNNWEEVFTKIYARKTVEYTVSELEKKLNIPSGTLRIKK